MGTKSLPSRTTHNHPKSMEMRPLPPIRPLDWTPGRFSGIPEHPRDVGTRTRNNDFGDRDVANYTTPLRTVGTERDSGTRRTIPTEGDPESYGRSESGTRRRVRRLLRSVRRLLRRFGGPRRTEPTPGFQYLPGCLRSVAKQQQRQNQYPSPLSKFHRRNGS